VTLRRLNRHKVIEIRWLSGIENFVSERDVRKVTTGSQAFIATLLFDPSMSALPINVKQSSPSVGSFTHQ